MNVKPTNSERQAATLLEIASKCHALAAELALGMELTKARYWQEKAEHAEALAAKIAKAEPVGADAMANFAKSGSTPANSPCRDAKGFVSHSVEMIETKRGQRWKCRKCGKVLE